MMMINNNHGIATWILHLLQQGNRTVEMWRNYGAIITMQLIREKICKL